MSRCSQQKLIRSSCQIEQTWADHTTFRIERVEIIGQGRKLSRCCVVKGVHDCRSYHTGKTVRRKTDEVGMASRIVTCQQYVPML